MSPRRDKETVCFTVCTVSVSLSVLHEEMDDEDCERRRGECLDEMLDLEKQFQELKEK